MLEVLLGSRSLDDLLNRFDVAEAVAAQDAKVLRDVKQFRARWQPESWYASRWVGARRVT